MSVVIKWHDLEDPQDFHWYRYLYAVISRRRELVYIGQAWNNTVSQRLSARDKAPVYEFLADNGHRDLWAIAGQIHLPADSRLTSQLMDDLESLLIYEEQPIGNIQSAYSRGNGRPGLVVACTGAWPGQPRYIDPGPVRRYRSRLSA